MLAPGCSSFVDERILSTGAVVIFLGTFFLWGVTFFVVVVVACVIGAELVALRLSVLVAVMVSDTTTTVLVATSTVLVAVVVEALEPPPAPAALFGLLKFSKILIQLFPDAATMA